MSEKMEEAAKKIVEGFQQQMSQVSVTTCDNLTGGVCVIKE